MLKFRRAKSRRRIYEMFQQLIEMKGTIACVTPKGLSYTISPSVVSEFQEGGKVEYVNGMVCFNKIVYAFELRVKNQKAMYLDYRAECPFLIWNEGEPITKNDVDGFFDSQDTINRYGSLKFLRKNGRYRKVKVG